MEKKICSEISSRLMHLFEEAKADLTKDPITAEEFFDDLEMKADDLDPIFAQLINFYAVTLYGTTPIPDNVFLEE